MVFFLFSFCFLFVFLGFLGFEIPRKPKENQKKTQENPRKPEEKKTTATLHQGGSNFACGANYPHQALKGGYFVFVWRVGT
jgi:hypothetical protein